MDVKKKNSFKKGYNVIEIDEDKLIRCPVCDAVNIDKGKKNTCRRCGSAIYHHRSFSTEKSWAFLITAMIAYIPANLYPMLITSAFGSEISYLDLSVN